MYAEFADRDETEEMRPVAAGRDEIRQMLVDTIGMFLRVKPDRLSASRRGTAHTAFARHVAMYLARTRLGLSFTEAGRLFNRDRTTAAHACRRIEESRDDATTDALIEFLDRAVELRAAALPRGRSRR